MVLTCSAAASGLPGASPLAAGRSPPAGVAWSSGQSKEGRNQDRGRPLVRHGEMERGEVCAVSLGTSSQLDKVLTCRVTWGKGASPP